MTELDRRTLFGAAGATVLLTGCGAKGVADKTEPNLRSPCSDYGDSPRKADGKKPPQNIPWKPEFFCVVYINMDGGTFVARQAYYPTGFTQNQSVRDEPSSIKTEALAALKYMSDNQSWPGNPKYPTDNFEDFWFGSQQEIYIFVDGTLATIDPDVLMVFGKNKTKPTDPTDPVANKTFYNAQALKGAVNGKDVTFVQNWFLNRSGNAKISKNPSTNHTVRPADVYAMNIQILLGAAGIPGVIDPNTGNGAGNEP